jgi:lipopolysaccharide transport protein LptA
MKFFPYLPIAALLAFAPIAFGQSNTPSTRASITAGEPAESKDALGLGVLGKNRPKDAKTEITAEKEATFDNAQGLATFVGKVIVRDPQLVLTCDKLVVTLDKNRKGMEKAEATGNVVIVHEGVENGKPVKSICRSKVAIYEPTKGDLLLLVWPQIQQGINLHISTEEGTRMTLNREGRMNTQGGNKTVISDTSPMEQQPTPQPRGQLLDLPPR